MTLSSFAQSMFNQGLLNANWTDINNERLAGDILKKIIENGRVTGFDVQPFIDRQAWTEIISIVEKLRAEFDANLEAQEAARRTELTATEREIEDLKRKIALMLAQIQSRIDNDGQGMFPSERTTINNWNARLSELTGFLAGITEPTIEQLLGVINRIEIFADQRYTVNVFDRITGRIITSGLIQGNSLWDLFQVGNRIEFTNIPLMLPPIDNIPQNPFYRDRSTGEKIFVQKVTVV